MYTNMVGLRIKHIGSRYLLVKTNVEGVGEAEETSKVLPNIPLVKLDPAHPLTLSHSGRSGGQKRIQFPEPSYKLEKLLKARQKEYFEQDFDEDDKAIFEAKETPANSQREVIIIEDSPPPTKGPVLNDWKHDAEWVSASIAHLMPPPFEASPAATMALQRELRAMLKEQDSATSLKEVGWYMPPDFMGDNLFQWIVELHSFDEALPLAKEMVNAYVGLLLSIYRYRPVLIPDIGLLAVSIPSSSRFDSHLRSLLPRRSSASSSLVFCHSFREVAVTSQEVCYNLRAYLIRNTNGGLNGSGGSMCMDLLTSDGKNCPFSAC